MFNQYLGNGKNYPKLAGPNGVLFDLTDTGALLFVRMHRPGPKVIKAFQSGKPLEARMTMINDVIYLLFKFGELNWMTAPYSVHQSLILHDLMEIPEGYGIATTIVLCDTNGTIRHTGFVTLSHDFSSSLMDAICRQNKHHFNGFMHNAEIKRVFSTYSTRDLVHLSSAGMKL